MWGEKMSETEVCPVCGANIWRIDYVGEVGLWRCAKCGIVTAIIVECPGCKGVTGYEVPPMEVKVK